jgi:transcription initiation factor TFIIB
MNLSEEVLTIIMQDPITINICSTCKRRDMVVTDTQSGEIICSNCGMVISDKTQDINRAERRAFSPEEAKDRMRLGSPSSLARYDMGLATVIGDTNTDASGRHIDAAMRSRMHRLRIWDSRARIYNSGRNLVHALDELDILKDKLGLSGAVVEKAAYIYRKALDRRLVRGRTTLGIMAAATYAGCREMEMPWTLKDIAAASNLKRKDIARNYRMLLFELDLKIPNADPLKCISKVANKANLTENTKRHAISIMNEVATKGISAGKDPMGMAASIVYISCLKTGEDRTQTQIADVSGVTDVTVRNRLKELKNKLHLH